MKDRIPTKILSNGALRYGVYDEAETLLRYEYIKPEDEPTQEGNPLCKATLLDDSACIAMGLPTSSVPNDALTFLGIGENRAFVEATVYETGTTTPISNVLIDGIKTRSGADVYTDSGGVARGFSTTTTTAIGVNTEYVDLAVPAARSFSTPLGKKTVITLYATRKTNTGNLETVVTSSGYYRFTNKVLVDVHVCGGGMDGGYGYSSGNTYGGNGGDGGRQAYQTNIVPDPETRYQAIVGARGGGTSNFMGVNSSSGIANPGGVGWRAATSGTGEVASTPGNPNTVKKYGTGDTNFAGGSGGGGDRYYATRSGGSPYGGKGGAASNNTLATDATGYGGGGGGGSPSSSSTTPGEGYQGAIWFRWRYAV